MRERYAFEDKLDVPEGAKELRATREAVRAVDLVELERQFVAKKRECEVSAAMRVCLLVFGYSFDMCVRRRRVLLWRWARAWCIRGGLALVARRTSRWLWATRCVFNLFYLAWLSAC